MDDHDPRLDRTFHSRSIPNHVCRALSYPVLIRH